jgi:hypothetical protein
MFYKLALSKDVWWERGLARERRGWKVWHVGKAERTDHDAEVSEGHFISLKPISCEVAVQTFSLGW